MNYRYIITLFILALVAPSRLVLAKCGDDTITIQYALDKGGYKDVALFYAPTIWYYDCESGKQVTGYPGIEGGTWSAVVGSDISIGQWGTSDNVTQGEAVSPGANVFICGHFTEDEIGTAYCTRTQ